MNLDNNNLNLFCPNELFSNGTVSIGEFKTIEEAMSFPIKEIWCVNRTSDNKFDAYKTQKVRILIICNWSLPIQNAQKYVIALLTKNGRIAYWDMNDLPIYTRGYENSINKDVLDALYSIADEYYRQNQTKSQINCNKKNIKDKAFSKIIRLTENELYNLIEEAVKDVIG